MTITDVYGLYLATGVAHLLLAFYALQRTVRLESTPSEQHIPFGDALATAHTASQVYEEEYLEHYDEESSEAA